MAPAARLVVVETARSEAGAAEGIADVVGAENDVVARGLADVISQSFAEAEGTVGALSATVDTRSAFVASARQRVTMLAAAGDRGPSGPRPDGGCCLLGGAVWPASDPLVTAVGGTSLRLGAEGERLVDDRVWSDSSGSSGGGLSRIFGRPAFQDGVAGVVGDRRGTPDLSLSAGVDDGAPLYYGSFAAPASPDRWRLGGGTSEATPLLAGIVALADQAAGHRLGPLGDVLYGLAANGDPGIRDITSGDSGFSGCLQRCGTGGAPTVRVPGYAAARGYDLASGLGTVDADRLVAALAGRPPRAGAGP
jgi:subtilase family serine protease